MKKFNIKKPFLTFLIIICLQLVVYIFFFRPFIFSWGATENETKMSLPGDKLTPFISSTRSISINTSKPEVWKWLIQLGADRGGFFSYDFIETPLGYRYRHQKKIVPEFQKNESKSLIKYNWPAVLVEPGEFFVLKGWGAFVLKEIEPKQTRLIVRTHGWELSSLNEKLKYFVMMPLHYIMERKMLLGIKARAETGSTIQISSIPDVLWFLGIIFSGIVISIYIFISKDVQTVLWSSVFSIIWLWTLLIFDPQPFYSMMLLITLSGPVVWPIYRK